MRIIDPHVHADFVSFWDVESMGVAGVEAAVILSKHMVDANTKPKDLFEYFESLFTFHKDRFEDFGIKVFIGLGTPVMGFSLDDTTQFNQELKKFLKRPEVVTVGEVGIEYATEKEAKKFKEQLEIAKEFNRPVVCHTPVPHRASRKVSSVKKVLEIVRETKFPIERIEIDHNSEDSVDIVLDAGAWAAISTCADKLTAKETALIVKRILDKRDRDADRILVNSEFGWGHNGYFSLPRVALEMRLLGIKSVDVEKILYENPIQFFNLKI